MNSTIAQTHTTKTNSLNVSTIISVLMGPDQKNWKKIIKEIQVLRRKKHQMAFLLATLVYERLIELMKDGNTKWLPFLHELLFEISIIGFYVGEHKLSMKSSNRVIFSKKTDYQMRESVFRNLQFYIKRLDYSAKYAIKFKSPPITNPKQQYLGKNYATMNPCIIRIKINTDINYMILIRCVNYHQTDAEHFYIMDKTEKAHTKNFIMLTDKSFEPIQCAEIIEDLDREREQTTVLGLEDVRFSYSEDGRLIDQWKNGGISFTCTTIDTNKERFSHMPIPQISLCRLGPFKSNTQKKKYNDDPKMGIIKVTSMLPMKKAGVNRKCEKNWTSFYKDVISESDTSQDKIQMVYTLAPTEIVESDINGVCKPVLKYEYPWEGNFLRGSAGPLRFVKTPTSGVNSDFIDKGEWIFVSHEVSHGIGKDSSKRKYYHRFLLADKNMKIFAASESFYYDHKGIEFCTSITLSPDGKSYLMGVGLEDKQAIIYEIESEIVTKMIFTGKDDMTLL